jgi:hypothetical protein
VSLDALPGERPSVIGPKEFDLGLSGVGQRKNYRGVKQYRRGKRWLS